MSASQGIPLVQIGLTVLAWDMERNGGEKSIASFETGHFQRQECMCQLVSYKKRSVLQEKSL